MRYRLGAREMQIGTARGVMSAALLRFAMAALGFSTTCGAGLAAPPTAATGTPLTPVATHATTQRNDDALRITPSRSRADIVAAQRAALAALAP